MPAAGKTAKSRSGCSTCKQRRVKCDEGKPSCRQCTLKGLECPGYATRWKWSSKHERHWRSSLQPQPAPVPDKKRASSVVSRGSPELATSARRLYDERPGDNDNHDKPNTETTNIETNAPVDAFSQWAEQAPLQEQEENVSPPGVQLPSPQDSSTQQSPTASRRPSLALGRYSWQPLDTILSNTQIQVDLFTQDICKSLSAFDSTNNPFRMVAMSRARESLLFFSLCRYITAAFLNSGAVDAAATLAVQNAQAEILHRLHNEIAQLKRPTRTKIEDVLMAIVMFGLTTNWDGSNNPSIFHYNAAMQLYQQAYGNSWPYAPYGEYQQFFVHALVYWWMGLAFVTDTTTECLLGPPPSQHDVANHSETNMPEKRIPHPLAGVSPEAQRVLGQVGLLIHAQRLRCRRKPFTSMNQLQKEYEALQQGHSLEEEALSLEMPRADDFVDVGDTETPIQHLINIAEVYRLAALILLYRSFPDLLDSRLGFQEDQHQITESADERRLLWVTALATHALNILCQNGRRSGTRSIEQILLIIIAGELQKRTYSQHFELTEGSGSSSSGPLISGFDPLSPLSTSPSDQPMALNNLSGYEAEKNSIERSVLDSAETNCIMKSRNAVLERLQAIRQVLPYRSIEIVEELVLKTWEAGDDGNPNVFWMDIMIDNDWKILLV
ncbi:hypothetical protein ABEF93_000132 [Exophiala dermatitidis]